MAYEIVWTPEAYDTFDEIIGYLKNNWSEKVVSEFVNKTNRKLLMLSQHPQMYPLISKTGRRRKAVIHKRVLVYYKSNQRRKEVELLFFWNTYQNPRRLQF